MRAWRSSARAPTAASAAELFAMSSMLTILAQAISSTVHPDYLKEHGAAFRGKPVETISPQQPRKLVRLVDDCCACQRSDYPGSAGAGVDAVSCLVHCGYAIIPDAVADKTTLNELRVAFHAWNEEDAARFQRAANGTNIQKPRLRHEYGLPDVEPYSRAAFLDERIVRMVIDVHDALGEPAATPTLESYTIINSLPGSDKQVKHKDSPFVDAIKMQVPLLDVDSKMGPIDIFPTKNNDGCPVVSAISKLGTAVFYMSTTFHRGTSNKGSVPRPSLDYNFMLPESAYAYDYYQDWVPRWHVLEAMQAHNARFVQGCTGAGLVCAPFKVPLLEVSPREQKVDLSALSIDDFAPSIGAAIAVLILLSGASMLGLV